MKERPILFSSTMVRAILDGRKTQTRRAVKLGEGWSVDAFAFDATRSPPWRMGVYEAGCAADVGGINCPYGEPGDRLWVRETFHHCAHCEAGAAAFRAGGWIRRPRVDGPDRDDNDARPLRPKCAAHGWTPSIHMPRWASRITLEVASVRVERLHDISEADAKAEGADRDFSPCEPEDREDPREVGYSSASDVALYEATAHRRFFRSLWESINGADSWAANPWVWVVEFRRVTP